MSDSYLVWRNVSDPCKCVCINFKFCLLEWHSMYLHIHSCLPCSCQQGEYSEMAHSQWPKWNSHPSTRHLRKHTCSWCSWIWVREKSWPVAVWRVLMLVVLLFRCTSVLKLLLDCGADLYVKNHVCYHNTLFCTWPHKSLLCAFRKDIHPIFLPHMGNQLKQRHSFFLMHLFWNRSLSPIVKHLPERVWWYGFASLVYTECLQMNTTLSNNCN